ncbi:hypothetical protein [Acinetobacter sp. YK3]|uniref:hypothetical protein n=1 Tax=Acinetobacter sp. YK3 TaxID=1860097 RepID=UPI000ADD7BEF|nr:hypothetical protein [Acinetobacter sp. YK3]
MKINPSSQAELEKLDICYLDHFDKARLSTHPLTRLNSVKNAALKLREDMLAGNTVNYYQTVDLIRVPYPTKYGLLNACTVPTPFMHILNRLFIVQFKTLSGLKTLLFSPSDVDANRETPYFKRLEETAPLWLRDYISPYVAPLYNRVEDALAQIGIQPEEIDYISYDHLHTQDLRKWLGTKDSIGLFPNAKLLVMHQEWCSTLQLLPPQKEWYCPNGINEIDYNKLILLEKSVLLGEGVALVASPGHTEGNHSLVVNTPIGILVSSENGVCADSFSPLNSNIPGVRAYATATGMEVILNGNTLEGGLDQYISMVMEKTLAGPCQENGDFYNFVPSSEMSAYWALPGLKPTFSLGSLKFGQLQASAIQE